MYNNRGIDIFLAVPTFYKMWYIATEGGFIMIRKFNENDYENVNGGITLRQYNCNLPDCAEGGIHYEMILEGINDFKNCIGVFANIPELAEKVSLLKAFVHNATLTNKVPKLSLGVTPQTWFTCENEFNKRGIDFSRIYY